MFSYYLIRNNFLLASDLDFQLKKKTGTDRDFNDNDWVMGTLSSCLVSGHLKCPTKEGKIARNIWFCCKGWISNIELSVL